MIPTLQDLGKEPQTSFLEPENQCKINLPHISTWMVDFRPRRLSIYVVFDIESESEVENA